MNILVVDDEKEIADLVELYLKNEGFQVFKFYNGCDALRCVETQDIDLAVLDIMLPDIDGLKICSKISSLRRQNCIKISSIYNSIISEIFICSTSILLIL